MKKIQMPAFCSLQKFKAVLGYQFLTIILLHIFDSKNKKEKREKEKSLGSIDLVLRMARDTHCPLFQEC